MDSFTPYSRKKESTDNIFVDFERFFCAGSKVAFFLFPGISLGVTHSLKIDKSVFFSEKVEKKQMFFIFSQE